MAKYKRNPRRLPGKQSKRLYTLIISIGKEDYLKLLDRCLILEAIFHDFKYKLLTFIYKYI